MALELLTEFSQYTSFIIADKLNDFKLDPVKENVQPEILQTYILQRISWYTVHNWVGGQLHEYFQDDFKNWDKTMMDKCQNSVINLLRDFLVKHGVYVPRDRKIQNSVKFLNILKEEDFHEWTEQEITYQVKHGGGFSPNFDPWYGKGPSESQKVTQLSQCFDNIGILL
ncbi:hypothetical protein GcM3_186037 [Golovinomyces cichoracearum]|uniref:Uncharacterized protein n=1 Tax=Golovinomyces cichoracearum TaxID=62708 RepID=A0A420HJS0_9PEZI|nr:hypothetical protein GcM3_186037 [Golovinomyces cichoracearum]